MARAKKVTEGHSLYFSGILEMSSELDGVVVATM